MLLQTERLSIRPIHLDDWISVRSIARDFRSGPCGQYDHPMPETDIALQEVVRFFAKSGAVYSVLMRDTGKMIGYVCLWPEEGAMELGYCFHSAWHEKGLAFEACSALIAFMHEERGVSSFRCGTALENKPSLRLLARLGFEQTETGFASFYKDAGGNDILFPSGSFRKEFSPAEKGCSFTYSAGQKELNR